MTREEVQKMYLEDFGPYDLTNLCVDSRDSAKLQGKYYSLWIREKYMLNRLEHQYEIIADALRRYWDKNDSRRLEPEEVESLGLKLDGLKAQELIASKERVAEVIGADKNIVNLRLKIANQKIVVDALEHAYRFGISTRERFMRLSFEELKYKNGS